MLNSASGIRARSLLRQYWVATIALGVFAGVAGGTALGVWGIARRTSTVYDRFVAYESAATLAVMGCPADVTMDEAQADFFGRCGNHDYADVREFLSTVEGVESSSRWTLGLTNVAAADHPTGGWRQLTPIAIDPGAFAAIGTPFVLEGRLSDPAAADEATINEEAARRLGVGLGDELIVTPFTRSQFDEAGEGVSAAEGRPMRVIVVGVTRRSVDLLGRLGGDSVYEDTSSVMVGPEFWNEIDGDVANYSVGLVVDSSPELTAGALDAAIQERWPGRPVFVEEGQLLGSNSYNTVVDAIQLQTMGLYVVASLVGLASLVFAGQAVARQVRREWSDAPVLDAIGMTRPGMIAAAVVRSVGFVAVSVVVGGIVATAMSPFGPVGIGRAAEPSPGLRFDWVVAAAGLPLIAASVVACAVVPVATIRQQLGRTDGLAKPSRLAARLPPTGAAGWALTRSRSAGGLALGSAVIGCALASAAGVAAWSLSSSYDDLVAHPARYGSVWAAQVGNVASVEQQIATRERIAAVPGVTSVGILTAEGIGDDPEATLFAADPFLGDVAFGAITAGRAPMNSNEIALGRHTMEREVATIGEEVEIAEPGGPGRFAFTVVGEVVVNDAVATRPGRGALVTHDAFTAMTGGSLSQTYAVWVAPGADRRATLAALEAEFPTTFLERSTPRSVRNLGLVSKQPALLAALVGLLAGAALVHALVTSVRRARRQLGVLKTVGFTRRQIASTVAWHASALALWALVIGIPLGIIAARVLWTQIARSIGLESAPVISVPAVFVVVLVVFSATNLAALGPGIVAARIRPAQALRAE